MRRFSFLSIMTVLLALMTLSVSAQTKTTTQKKATTSTQAKKPQSTKSAASKKSSASKKGSASKKSTAVVEKVKEALSENTWIAEYDSESGLYRYKDEVSGKVYGLPGFANLEDFKKGESWKIVELEGKKYIMLRNGMSLLDRGVDDIKYTDGENCFVVSENGKSYFLDFLGRRISKEYVKIERSYYERDFYLCTEMIDGEVVSRISYLGNEVSSGNKNFKGAYLHSKRRNKKEIPEYIRFYDSNFKDSYYNMEGKLVYQGIENSPFTLNLRHIFDKKISDLFKCSEEGLDRYVYVAERRYGKIYDIYDLTGLEIAKNVKLKSVVYSDKNKRFIRKYLVPFYSKEREEELNKRYDEMIYEPAKRFMARMEERVAEMPKEVSLSSSKNIDLFALTKDANASGIKRKKEAALLAAQAPKEPVREAPVQQAYSAPQKKTSFLDRLGNALDALATVADAVSESTGSQSSRAVEDDDLADYGHSGNNTNCSFCNSTGYVKCQLCNNGIRACKTCNGSGKYSHYDTRRQIRTMQTCTICEGAGSFTCAACKGSGYIPCKYCKGGGNDSNLETHKDTRSIQEKYKCYYCHGNQKCPNCAGRGQKRNRYNNELYDCDECRGTGRCRVCHGKGYKLR